MEVCARNLCVGIFLLMNCAFLHFLYSLLQMSYSEKTSSSIFQPAKFTKNSGDISVDSSTLKLNILRKSQSQSGLGGGTIRKGYNGMGGHEKFISFSAK